jgi:hypothetical protein
MKQNLVQLTLGLGGFRVLWCILWQKLQVLQDSVGHVASEGGAIFF